MAVHLHPTAREPVVGLSRDGGVAELRLHGEIDLARAPELQAVNRRLQITAGDTVVANLTGATFVDSTVITWLVGVAERTEAAGAALVVLVVPGPVRRLLDMAGVSGFLTVTEPPELPLPPSPAEA